MSDAKEVYHGFFLVKLPQPVNGHYIIRAACFKEETDFRRKLKLRIEEDTENKTECDYKYGQLLVFSTNEEKLKDYSIVEINDGAATLFERNMIFPDSIRYRMKSVTVLAAHLQTPGIYMNPTLGEMRDPKSIIQLGRVRLAEFEVMLQDENEFTYEVRDIADMKIIDLMKHNMMEEGLVFEDKRIGKTGGIGDAQHIALKMALNENRKAVVIQGAPGTGKTFFLASLLLWLVFRKKKAIVLTPTAESLKQIWHTSEKNIKQTNLYTSETFMDIVKFDQTMKEFNKNGEKHEHKEEREELMSKVNVVFDTFGSPFLEDAMRYKSFNPCVLIIDNSNLVSESQKLPAYLQGMRMVIAGDPSQLSPMDFSEGSSDPTHQKLSIMDRMINVKERFSWVELDQEYRCFGKVFRWSNQTFFKGLVKDKMENCDTLVKSIERKNKPPSKYSKLFDRAVFIDTSTVTNEEDRVLTYEKLSDSHLPGKHTYENSGEKDIALVHYKHLRKLCIAAKDIAILTCYQGQVDLLRAGMEENIENGEMDTTSRETTIALVDSVQGLEFDCVIFSMVRSNPKLTMGIVAEPRRINVLMTRAKRHLFFIGNGLLLADQDERTKIKKLLVVFSTHTFHPNQVRYTDPESKPERELYFKDFDKFTNDDTMKSPSAPSETNHDVPKIRGQGGYRKV